eukprot:5623136-Lingulodinium_polyedra.AAC.1
MGASTASGRLANDAALGPGPRHAALANRLFHGRGAELPSHLRGRGVPDILDLPLRLRRGAAPARNRG